MSAHLNPGLLITPTSRRGVSKGKHTPKHDISHSLTCRINVAGNRTQCSASKLFEPVQNHVAMWIGLKPGSNRFDSMRIRACVEATKLASSQIETGLSAWCGQAFSLGPSPHLCSTWLGNEAVCAVQKCMVFSGRVRTAGHPAVLHACKLSLWRWPGDLR